MRTFVAAAAVVAADQSTYYHFRGFLDLEGSTHIVVAAHTGSNLAVKMVESKRKVPGAGKCFPLDHFHYLH